LLGFRSGGRRSQLLADGGDDLRWRLAMGQRRRESSLGIDDVGDRRVVYRVLPVGIRWLLLVPRAILPGDRGDLLRRAGEADQAWVKEVGVILETGGRIALRVERDEDRLDALAFACFEFGKGLRQQRQRRGTDIRAVGVAEVDQHYSAAIILEGDRSVRPLQGEIATWRACGLLKLAVWLDSGDRSGRNRFPEGGEVKQNAAQHDDQYDQEASGSHGRSAGVSCR